MADIPSSSITVFRQSVAQTGWTKLTSVNDYTLRVVSGTVGTGGSNPFSTTFSTITPSGTVTGSGTANGVALDQTQLPSHTHAHTSTTSAAYPTTITTKTAGSAVLLNKGPKPPSSGFRLPLDMGNAGGTDTHAHPLSVSVSSPGFTGTGMNFNVKYVDIILAQRN